MYNKKKTTIIVMMVAVFAMVIGYAAFSANLNIAGTANIASNWNVYISNVETKTVYGKAENATWSPTYSNLTAKMTADLKEPGDYITYEVTVTNGGSLDAVIEEVKTTNLGTSAIIHTIDGVNKGDSIPNGESIKFTVTIKYDPAVTSQPETTSNTSVLDIKCVQDLNQNIQGGDIENNTPTVTTLSGNNTLTLNNAFPTNLANYKISGNSVQDKLPDEYQEVEYLEGTGTQYIEIDYIASGATVSKGKFQITNIEKSGFLFGSRGLSSSMFYGFNWGGGLPYKYYNAYGAGYLTTVNIDDQVHTFSKQKGNLYIDGTTIHSVNDDDFVTPGKMNIFAAYNDGASGYLPSVVKLYYLQFYDNGQLSVNLIPCYRKSDNVIGLYDSVNDKFYTNKGTGTFSKGSDITTSTPTPDVPIEVISVGEKTKNLISVNSYELTGVTLNKVIFEGNLSLPAILSWDIDYIPNNSAALFEFVVDGTSKYVRAKDLVYNITGTTLTRIKIVNWPSDVGNVTNIQLEAGSVATNYESYGYKIPVKVSNGIEETITNIYLDEPLRKAGNYYDYIDFENGKVVRNLKEVELDGTGAWALYPNTTAGYTFYKSFIDSIMEYQSSLSSHFVNVNYAWGNTATGIYSDHDSVTNKYFKSPNSDITTVDQFKNWLSSEKTKGTPVKLIYTLAKPIEENITLPQINIPQGNVTISINSNGLTIPIEVSYYKK